GARELNGRGRERAAAARGVEVEDARGAEGAAARGQRLLVGEPDVVLEGIAATAAADDRVDLAHRELEPPPRAMRARLEDGPPRGGQRELGRRVLGARRQVVHVHRSPRSFISEASCFAVPVSTSSSADSTRYVSNIADT